MSIAEILIAAIGYGIGTGSALGLFALVMWVTQYQVLKKRIRAQVEKECGQ